MDLGRIRAHGVSSTRKAWVSNPIRSMLWRLTLPYFKGTITEVSEHLRDRNNVYSETTVASHLAGAKKDAMALAHRLAGLEEEAAEREQATAAATAQAKKASEDISSLRQEMQATTAALTSTVEAATTQAHEANRHVANLHEDVRSSVQTLTEAASAAAAQARDVGAHVSALQQEVGASIQAINERIDSVLHGPKLRAGDRVPVGRDGLTLVRTAAGTRFLLREHDLIGRLVANGQEWEPHVRDAIERAARPDGVAVDAGAYIGLHTVTMSRCFGAVHAFEPQRGIYHLLCGNLALNGCNNVTAHNVALYDRSGPMRLAPPDRQEISMPMLGKNLDYGRISNAAALTFEAADAEAEHVSASVLDDLGLEGVAFMKVDTQGADLRVLRGAENTIRRNRPAIVFEWERDLGEQHGTKLEDYRSFFASLEYDLAVLQETSPGRQVDYLAIPR